MWYIIFFCFSTLLFSCNKSNKDDENRPNDVVKLEIISGDNQSDTAGHILRDSLVFKVSKNDLPYPEAIVRIIKEDCLYNDLALVHLDKLGIGSIAWKLNGIIGKQHMKLFAINDAGEILDSTDATANGLFFDREWLPSVCLPREATAWSFAEQTDGKILCNINSLAHPFYSTDRGITWSPLKTFSNQHLIAKIIANGNYLFIGTLQDGIWSSSDNGVTWQASNDGIDNFTFLSSFEITRSGKLFVNTISGVFRSLDTAKHFENISAQPNGLSASDLYFNFTEAPDGTLFVINDLHELWESTDGGGEWNKSSPTGHSNYRYVFIDDNGDRFLSISTDKGELYRSVNNGINWTLICSFTNKPGQLANIKDISKINNNFYFVVEGYGLMKTNDFNSFQLLKEHTPACYVITKSNSAIVSFDGAFDTNKLFYNMTP